jgi:hypothetical protein
VRSLHLSPLSHPRLHDTPHFSLRQLAEMPSLAGPKSRAQLASFTRLDDGAFCRVISASLWAPLRQQRQLHHLFGCSWRFVMVSWALLCHWPLAWPFFSFRLTEHMFSPFSWTGTRMAWLGYASRAGVLVRFSSPRKLRRSGGPSRPYCTVVVEGLKGI